MSIGEAVRGLITARGLRPAQAGDRLAGTRTPATLYQVLSDATHDPRVSTLVAICELLAVSPDELLQIADLLEPPGRAPALIDIELRQAFSEVKQLDEDDKRVCLAMLRGVIDLRAKRRRNAGRRRTPQPSEQH